MIEISVGPLAERRDSAEYVRVQTLFHRAGIMGIASIFGHQMLLRTDSMSQIANLVETIRRCRTDKRLGVQKRKDASMKEVRRDCCRLGHNSGETPRPGGNVLPARPIFQFAQNGRTSRR